MHSKGRIAVLRSMLYFEQRQISGLVIKTREWDRQDPKSWFRMTLRSLHVLGKFGLTWKIKEWNSRQGCNRVDHGNVMGLGTRMQWGWGRGYHGVWDGDVIGLGTRMLWHWGWDAMRLRTRMECLALNIRLWGPAGRQLVFWLKLLLILGEVIWAGSIPCIGG